MKRKVLAIFLSLAMVLALIAVPAMAGAATITAPADLQAAINGATAGDIIDLGGNTYNVTGLNITTSVTLQNGTINLVPRAPGPRNDYLSTIRITASGTVLQGLKIVGFDAYSDGTSTYGSMNIVIAGTTVNPVDNVTISGCEIVVGTAGFVPGGVPGQTISLGFSNYGAGIATNAGGSRTGLIITGNTFSTIPEASLDNTIDRFIYVDYGTVGTVISGNTFSGIPYGAAITIDNTEAAIENNTFDKCAGTVRNWYGMGPLPCFIQLTSNYGTNITAASVSGNTFIADPSRTEQPQFAVRTKDTPNLTEFSDNIIQNFFIDSLTGKIPVLAVTGGGSAVPGATADGDNTISWAQNIGGISYFGVTDTVIATVTDTAGNPLTGATFQLLDSSGVEVGTATSDANGQVMFTGLPYDGLNDTTYTVVQTAAPSGFAVASPASQTVKFLAGDPTNIVQSVSFTNLNAIPLIWNVGSNGTFDDYPGMTSVTLNAPEGDLVSNNAPAVTADPGYRFVGWFYDGPGGVPAGGPEMSATDVVSGSGNITAKWEPILYTFAVRYYNFDSTIATQVVQTIQYGDAFDANVFAPTPPAGYVWQWVPIDSWSGNVSHPATGTADDLAVTIPPSTIFVAFNAVPIPVYTVTWDGNGGAPASQVTTALAGDPITLPSVEPTQAGYTFAGWNTADDGSGDAITAETLASGDVTAYAIWTPLPAITFTWLGNGGMPASQITTSYAGDLLSILPSVTPPAGYEFAGWFDSDGALVVAPLMYSADATFTAQFNVIPPTTVTITWFLGDGTETVWDTTTPEVGSPIIAPVTPTRDGYTFAGWYYDDADGVHGAGAAHSDSDIAVSSGNVTATWTPIPMATVTFMPGDHGTFAPQSSTVEVGAPTPAAPVATGEDGWAFNGWMPSVEATVSADTTYTAQWVSTLPPAETVTITWLGLGGMPDVQTTTPAIGDPIELPEVAVPTRDGFTFAGWFYDDVNGVHAAGAPYNHDIAVCSGNVGAAWTPNVVPPATVTITWFLGDGTETVWNTTTPEVGSPIIAPVTPTRDGYTFAGWYYDDANGVHAAGAAHSDSDIAVSSGNVTATWTAVVPPTMVTVTWDSNGGMPTTPQTKSVELNTAIGDPATAPTKAGYTFVGWNTQANGSGTAVSAATPASEGLVAYAQWNLIPVYFTVTYDANGGTVTPTSWTQSAGALSTTLPTPTRSGYTFTGWKDPSGNILAAGSTYTPAANVTLTAQWQQNVTLVTLTWDGNGGTPTSQQRPATPGAPLTSTNVGNTPTRGGVLATGWTTVKDDPSTLLPGGAFPTINAPATNTTYYAWYGPTTPAPVLYTVTLNPDGGTVSPTSVTQASEGAAVTLPTPTKSGYTFAGWYTSGGTLVTSPYTPTANITLIAHWTPVPTYTVSFAPGDHGTFEQVNYPGLHAGDLTPAAPSVADNGYWHFVGWAPTLSTTVTGNQVYVAQWVDTTPAPTYTVSFAPGAHGTFEQVNYPGLHIGDLTPAAPTSTPGADGWAFDGWMPTIVDTVTGNQVYVAQWKATTMMVNTSVFGMVTPHIFAIGSTVSAFTDPVDPTGNEYDFSGWSLSAPVDGALLETAGVLPADEPLVAGTTYYAIFTMTFFSNIDGTIKPYTYVVTQ